MRDHVLDDRFVSLIVACPVGPRRKRIEKEVFVEQKQTLQDRHGLAHVPRQQDVEHLGGVSRARAKGVDHRDEHCGVNVRAQVNAARFNVGPEVVPLVKGALWFGGPLGNRLHQVAWGKAGPGAHDERAARVGVLPLAAVVALERVERVVDQPGALRDRGQIPRLPQGSDCVGKAKGRRAVIGRVQLAREPVERGGLAADSRANVPLLVEKREFDDALHE